MDVSNAAYTTSYTMLTVTWCCSACYCDVRPWDFEVTGGSVVRSNHLLWSHWVTVNMTWAKEKAPTPLFDRLVWCSAYEHSFARLEMRQYVQSTPIHIPIQSWFYSFSKLVSTNKCWMRLICCYLYFVSAFFGVAISYCTIRGGTWQKFTWHFQCEYQQLPTF